MPMSWTAIVCTLVCLVISFVIIFMLAGAIAPGAASHRMGQVILAAIAALVGLFSGSFVRQRFFGGR